MKYLDLSEERLTLGMKEANARAVSPYIVGFLFVSLSFIPQVWRKTGLTQTAFFFKLRQPPSAHSPAVDNP